METFCICIDVVSKNTGYVSLNVCVCVFLLFFKLAAFSFCWKTDRSTTALTVTPAKGFIRPGTEVLMDVTFAPLKLSEDMRCEVSCAVGSSCVLKLTVTGSCVMVSTNKEVRRPFLSS